ncbi:hypothetical protein FI667_g16458, partial [Globisporangium splendens]
MSTTIAATTASSTQHRGKWQREDVLLLLRAWSDVADQRDYAGTIQDNESESDGENDGDAEESALAASNDNDDKDKDSSSSSAVTSDETSSQSGKKRLRARLYEEKIAEFDARVYRHFLVLSGGNNASRPSSNAEIEESAAEDASEATQEIKEEDEEETPSVDPLAEPVPLNRTERAVIEKKDALMYSYHFIAQWMKNSANGNTGTGGEGRNWFALTKQQQKQEVRSGFKRIAFVYLDHEMFNVLEQLAQKKQKSKMRDRVGFQHWRDSEHIQLLRAWGEALRIVGTKRDLNRVLTERFLALGCDENGGKRQRSEASIIARKENMVFSYLFISAFSAQNEHRDWFSLTKAEKKQILLNAGHKSTRFVDIDEDMFDIIGMHLHTRVRKARQASNGEDVVAMETSAPSTPLVVQEAEEKGVSEDTRLMEYDLSANETSTQSDGAGAALDVDANRDDEGVTSMVDQKNLPQSSLSSADATLDTAIHENEAAQSDGAGAALGVGAHRDEEAVTAPPDQEKLLQDAVSSVDATRGAELRESDVPEDSPGSEGNAGSSGDPEGPRRNEADTQPLDTLLPPTSRPDGHALDSEGSRGRGDSHNDMEIHQNEPDPPSSEACAEPLDAPVPESKLHDDVLDNEATVHDDLLDHMEIHQNEPDPLGSEGNAESVESSMSESPKVQQQQPTTTASPLESGFPEWDKEYTSARNSVLPAEDSRDGSTTPPADPEQEATLNLFQKYADHFNTTLRQMQEYEENGREQRKREREELRVELEKRRRYREELVQDREQRARERDRMSQELEQMRVERQREREHDLALLRTILEQSRS